MGLKTNIETFRVLYKGKDGEYFVFVESEEAVKAYQKDSTVPLSDAVSIFKIYTTRLGGNEGILDEVGKQQLETEFDTSNTEEAIIQILKKGEFRAGGDVHRKNWNSTNDSNGVYNK